ncbi:hypothetical protein DFH07DRAFT_819160 [Mycena maculata]|uniref:C2H2-type domain-containing protein n=1 Tax=Mycena maculata TaxID=230809 RepID=A0AAD7J9W6_9AGAR|nr:hypothetical protein DFH07DRAFT_819160 [Mycena maculata]
MRAATTTFGPDLLMVPLPRRNSSNDQRPDVFFPENGASPDTPSSTSAFSSFPSSPSASGGASPTVLHPQVASSANLRASNSRRKKAALFRCIYYPECPATFTARHNLKNHVNSHAGIRPHRCPRCHHTFTTMAVMKRHLKKCKT